MGRSLDCVVEARTHSALRSAESIETPRVEPSCVSTDCVTTAELVYTLAPTEVFIVAVDSQKQYTLSCVFYFLFLKIDSVCVLS